MKINLEKKHVYFLTIFVLVFIGISYVIAQQATPNPGHSAAEIGDGTIANALTIAGGNVGIGTTGPDAKLDVSGGVIRALATAAPAAGLGTGMEMFFDSNGPEGRLVSLDRAGAGTYKPIHFGASTYQFDVSAAAKMVLDANGNVGIGTTNPTNKLHTVGGDESVLRVEKTPSGTPAVIVSGGYIIMDGGAYGIRGGTGQGMYLGANNLDVIYINTQGSVGIGTTTPNSKLQIGTPGAAGREYLQIDMESNAPASTDCDEQVEGGRMVYDNSNKRIWVCDGAGGWRYASTTQ